METKRTPTIIGALLLGVVIGLLLKRSKNGKGSGKHSK